MSRRRALLLVWTLPSAVFLAITAIVYGAYRIEPPRRLTDMPPRLSYDAK